MLGSERTLQSAKADGSGEVASACTTIAEPELTSPLVSEFVVGTRSASRRVSRPMRADARRNLERILDAARKVFAEKGVDATLDEVAKSAGVGIATVYRRFSDKYELLRGLLEADLAALVEEARRAAAAEDAFGGLVGFLERSLELQAANCALRDLVESDALAEARWTWLKNRLGPPVSELLRRAKEQGRLRADLETSDIALVALMLGAVADFARHVSPNLWRRYLAIVLEGMKSPEPPSLPCPALTEEEVDEAKRSWHPRHA
jgi:AcrR family transcriptional regulator